MSKPRPLRCPAISASRCRPERARARRPVPARVVLDVGRRRPRPRRGARARRRGSRRRCRRRGSACRATSGHGIRSTIGRRSNQPGRRPRPGRARACGTRAGSTRSCAWRSKRRSLGGARRGAQIAAHLAQERPLERPRRRDGDQRGRARARRAPATPSGRMSVTARSSSTAPAAGTLGAIARAEWARIWKLGKRRERYQTRRRDQRSPRDRHPDGQAVEAVRQQQRHGDAEHRDHAPPRPARRSACVSPRARKNAVQL